MVERMEVDGKMASVVGVTGYGPDAKVVPVKDAPFLRVVWDDGSSAHMTAVKENADSN